MTTTEQADSDSLITGFKPYFLITFIVAAVWVGVSPVLIPAYVLSVTGSATDVAMVLSLMALGAFAVPVLASAADRTRAHRPIQMLSLLLAASYVLLGLTDRPLVFAIVGMVAGLGLGATNLFLITYYLGGGYSDKAQADALARSSRTFLFGQVSGGLLVAAMLAADLPFELMFVIAGSLPLIAMVIAALTTKPLEERLLSLIHI